MYPAQRPKVISNKIIVLGGTTPPPEGSSPARAAQSSDLHKRRSPSGVSVGLGHVLGTEPVRFLSSRLWTAPEGANVGRPAR
jgi:hypothetical protein